MDAPSISIALSPAPLAGAPSPVSLTGDGGVQGADFANLLSHLMSPAGRQGLAAGVPGLQALPLGAHMEVITADEPPPDGDSLLAFARSQGLDDAMIRSLFGPAQALPQGGATVTAATAQPPAALTFGAAAGASLRPTPASVAALVPPTGVAGAPVPSGPAALLPPSPGLPAQVGEGGQGDAPDAAAGPTVASLAALGGTALRGLQVHAPAALASDASAQQAQVQASAAAEGAPALAQTAPMQDAVRLRLQPQETLTRRLAQMSGTGQQAVWGQLAGSAARESAPEPLVLGLDPSDEVVAAIASDGEAPLPPHAGHPLGESARLTNPASLAAPAPASTSAERAAQYEQLAQRLGQALGQRLQAQIERGEWKVQMQVDPVSLGRIDMELDMRSGGLDAVFRSDNQVTRDLIAQGLPRLRETLAQSGTAVANVWVQSDGGRQGGGNPTPGRGRFAGAPGVKETPAPAQEAVQAMRPRTGGDSAWDVLA